MNGEKTYTADDLIRILSTLQEKEEPDENITVAKRLRDKVTVNGKTIWLSGNTNQDLYDKYVQLLEKEGLIQRIDPDDDMPLLSKYLDQFFETYKTKQEQNTLVNRERIIRNHIKPKFGAWRLDKITTTSIQKWFNDLAKTYSKETILKIKNTLSPVFDSAVEDEIITRNPLKSKRIEICGREVEHHKALPKAKMDEIKAGLMSLQPNVRNLGGLLCYTGMRFEEALGCKFEDFSGEWLTIRRAVVHPDRNQPIIKATKTATSNRIIPCPEELKNILSSGPQNGFVVASKKDPTRQTPLSYTEARRAFDKLRCEFNIKEYSAHDFRDTCATIWRENGIPLDVIARLLGHAKTETTERRYVKYRQELLDDVRTQM